MSRKTIVNCDSCQASNIGEDCEIPIYNPREPGEMDGGYEVVALCSKCMAGTINRICKEFQLNAIGLQKFVPAPKVKR